MPGDTMPLRRSLEIQRGGACYIDFAPNGAGGQAAVPQSAVAAEAMADRTKRVRAVYHLDTGEALAKVDSTVCPPRAPCPTPHAFPLRALRGPARISAFSPSNPGQNPTIRPVYYL